MSKKILLSSLLLFSFFKIQSAAGQAPVNPQHFCFRTLTPPPYEMEKEGSDAWLKNSKNFKQFELQLLSNDIKRNFNDTYHQASNAVAQGNNELAKDLLHGLYDRIWFYTSMLKTLYFHKKWDKERDIDLLGKFEEVANHYRAACVPQNFGASLLHYRVINNLEELDHFRCALTTLRDRYHDKKEFFENRIIQLPVTCVICNKQIFIDVPFKEKDFVYSITCYGDCTERHQAAALLSSMRPVE